MNYRLNSTAMIALGVLVLVAVGIFAYTYLRGAPAPQQNENAAATTTPEVAGRRIDALHQFKNGIHTIVGETDVPTPCHLLSTAATVRNSQPNDILVEFTASSSAEACAQIITPTRFKVSFEAPENAMISATYNGEPVTFNLVPAPAGEDLDTFEEYFKG